MLTSPAHSTPATGTPARHDLAAALRGLPRLEPDNAFRETARSFTSFILQLSGLGDALVTAGALCLAFWLRFHTALVLIGTPDNHTTFEGYFGYILTGVAGMVSLLASASLYDRTKILRYQSQTLGIFKSCVLWELGVLVFISVFDLRVPPSRIFIALSFVLSLGGLLMWRLALTRLCSIDRFAHYLCQRILFVGWNDLSARFSHFINTDPSKAYALAGCVPGLSGNYEEEPPANIPHLAAHQDLKNILKARNIDIVILADRTASMDNVDELVSLCERELIDFKVIPSYFQILLSGLRLQTISGLPILGISTLPLDTPVNFVLKRTVDIVGSLFGLLISAPLIAVFGTLIYLESPGSIFYRQDRLGRKGRKLRMIKLRSMRLDADRTDHLSQSTVRNDPRVLKIGSFLRRWNLDETPQFWNVLKGEMSLVGPRPEREFHSRKLSGEIPHYNARYYSKPGMTGWAAVNGFRGDTDLTERIRCDLYYLENWSLWLDFQIMFLTLFRSKSSPPHPEAAPALPLCQ